MFEIEMLEARFHGRGEREAKERFFLKRMAVAGLGEAR